MKGSKCGFTFHDKEQICQNNRVHTFLDLEFGIDVPTTGSTQYKSTATAWRKLCFTDQQLVYNIGLSCKPYYELGMFFNLTNQEMRAFCIVVRYY